MRTRSNPLPWSVMLLVPLVLSPGAVLADHHEEEGEEVQIEEYTGGTRDARDEAEAQSDVVRLSAMTDVRFGPDTHIFSRIPFGLNRMGDLVFLRGLNIALGAVGAATYVIAVGPTLAFDADQHDELVDDLLIEPWRLLWYRPLGGPMDFRARDAVAADSSEIPIE